MINCRLLGLCKVRAKDFLNLFDINQHGLEITTKHRWGDNNLLTLNYAYQVMSSNVKLTYAGDYADTMPRHIVSALYAKKFANNVSLSMGYYQQGTMLPIDRGPKDRQEFTRRIDLKLGKQFKVDDAGHKAEVAVVVQGLVGDDYHDYQIQNQYRRRAFLTASVEF